MSRPRLHHYINVQNSNHSESGSTCRPRLALALKTDQMGVTQTLHAIGQTEGHLYAIMGRSGRKELNSALADALLL